LFSTHFTYDSIICVYIGMMVVVVFYCSLWWL